MKKYKNIIVYGVTILLVFGMVQFLIINQYYADKINQIDESNKKEIKTLKTQILELEGKITNYEKNEKRENNIYLLTFQKANAFMESFLNTDIDAIKKLVCSNINVTQNGIINENDKETMIKYSDRDNISFELNNYFYDEANHSIIYFYRVYKDETIPIYFINIELRKEVEKWKVYSIEFDI